MKKILCMIQLPPPIHGAAIYNEKVVGLLNDAEDVSVSVLRLNYADSFETMHAALYKKIFYSFFVFYSFTQKLITDKPNFIYISFSPFGPGFYRDLLIAVLANVFGSKVKAHLHGTGLNQVKSKFKRMLYKYFFSKVELILISEILFDDVSAFVKKEDVVVINNVVNTPVLNVEKYPATYNFLYVANLDRRKGVLKAIDIFAQLKKDYQYTDSKLNIVGADTFHLKQSDLHDYINLHYDSLIDSIDLHGAKYGKEKESVFLDSHIFLYPTAHDAAPLVVLEAQSYGMPVVVSSQGALPDMVQNGASGYIIENYSAEEYVIFIGKIIKKYPDFRCEALKVHISKNSNQVLKSKLEELFHE